MGTWTPAMERATVLTVLLLGLSAELSHQSEQDLSENSDQCLVSRVSHVCTGSTGPVIINRCNPFYDVSDIQECIRKGAEDIRMTCYPCCQDPGKSIQHCASVHSGEERPRWTFDIEAVPLIDPCRYESEKKECVQRFKKATGRLISRHTGIGTWEECQTLCQQTDECDWFTHIALGNMKCVLKKKVIGRRRRNLRRVAKSDGGYHYHSGSVLSSPISSPNCNCQKNSMYEYGNSWGWADPCPIGNRQTHSIMGRGIVQCCPQVQGSDGTPVCEY